MDPFSSREAVLFGAMARFLHGVANDAAAELETFGLTPAQFQLLVRVRERPQVSQWQLAEKAGVTRGNISQLVKKLETSRLVERVRSQGSDELTVTASGQALLDEVMPAHEEFMRRVFASLSDAQLDQLAELVQRLNR